MPGEHSSSLAPMREGANTDSDIRLTLPARPENVAVVRHVVSAFAEALGVSGAHAEDMRLAVTEACTNVVRHAYAEGEGSIGVVMRPTGDGFEIVVSDAGRGIGASSDTSGAGLGLSLIAALTESLEIERLASAGSRLTMSFPRKRTVAAAQLP